MSKSKGNVIEPWTVLDRQGADAFRWYLLTAQSPWESFRFSLEAVDEAMRRFLLTLWNTHAFLVTYASLPDGWSPGRPGPRPTRCARSTAGSSPASTRTVDGVTERLEAYDATGAGRMLEAFVDDLSNWYVRTGRRRFWGGRQGDGAAGGGARGRRRGLRDAARVPRDDQPARGPVLPLRRRGDLRHPRRGPRPRRARERPPGRLAPLEGPPRPGARGGDGLVPGGGRRSGAAPAPRPS